MCRMNRHTHRKYMKIMPRIEEEIPDKYSIQEKAWSCKLVSCDCKPGNDVTKKQTIQSNSLVFINSDGEFGIQPGHTVDSVMAHIIEKQKLRWDELTKQHKSSR